MLGAIWTLSDEWHSVPDLLKHRLYSGHRNVSPDVHCCGFENRRIERKFRFIGIRNQIGVPINWYPWICPVNTLRDDANRPSAYCPLWTAYPHFERLSRSCFSADDAKTLRSWWLRRAACGRPTRWSRSRRFAKTHRARRIGSRRWRWRGCRTLRRWKLMGLSR